MRVSTLPSLAMCPGFVELREMERRMGLDSRGKAADTGTATGRMCELWHRGGETGAALADAIERASAEASTSCPAADLEQAREWATAYTADSRNHGVVLPDRCEAEVRATIPPAPEDPTGEPVVLVGHIDQVRRTPRGLEVWDIKTGGYRSTGRDMILEYAWQIAGYAVACTETWGETVLPGGIIRIRGYDVAGKSPNVASVHYPTGWSLEACRAMLDVVAYRVAEIRRGVIAMVPGRACLWCPGGGPDLCPERIDVALR